MWEDLDKVKAHKVVGFFETENIDCASPGGACVRGGGLSRAVGGQNLVGASLVHKFVLAGLETAMSEGSPAAHSLSDGATIQKQSPRLPMTFRLQTPRRQRRANTREDE